MKPFLFTIFKKISTPILKNIGFKMVLVEPSTLPNIFPSEPITVVKRISNIGQMIEEDYGHYLSIATSSSVNKNFEPLPWFTYPAIQYLQQLDLSQKNIFEWGSGNSSLFFAERSKSVLSIEDNPEWYEKISKQKKPNHTIILISKEELFTCILSTGKKYDVIVIDGDNSRSSCIEPALRSLASNGMIILDNSDWFKNSAKRIREAGLIQVDMHGFGPINDYPWTTSFFLTRDFCFSPLSNIQPVNPIGGIKNVCD